MNAAFGIDHPLIAVRDIAGFRNRLISIGFNMTPIGKHPWGTSTSLAMFQGCLLEIMGVYDETLIDEMPAGEFRFGRHVYQHLQQREGVALSALHSTDAVQDADFVKSAGFEVSGHLEFGRDVTLPDGTTGRTKTSLALLPNAKWPRLSFFLCQQHRPELIYVPSWLQHANSVHGYAGVTVLVDPDDLNAVAQMLGGLYGAAVPCEGGKVLTTANGVIKLLTRATIEARNGPLPAEVTASGQPSIVALDLLYSDRDKLLACLRTGDLRYTQRGDEFCASDCTQTGNTFLNFVRG